MRFRFLLIYVCVAVLKTVFGRKFYCGMSDTVLITDYTQGEIKTRHHEGGFYANNLMCSWVIDAGDNRRVKLDVNLADLQWSPQYTTCSGYDNLQIIEGDSIEGKSIASVCGARNPYSVVSKGRYLFLQFSSTHQNFGNHKGVEVTFHTFDNQTCAPGWYQQPGDANSCLMIGSTGTASWTDSQDICTYSQSNLVSISNETEYQSIIEHGKNLSLSSAWIGLSDVQSEGKFKWVDTSSYPFVRSLSGNDFRKHCVSIDFNTDKWTVHECERTLLNYICKAKRDGSTVIYSADPASGPPIEVDESNNKTFLIVILVIGGVVFIVGLTLFVCCCVLKRNDRPCKSLSSSSHRKSDSKQEDPVFDHLHAGSGIGTSREPSAPPSDDIMLHDRDPQRVAPPTYDESLYHPVAPSCY